MASDQKKPALIPSMFTMKCPSCRKSTVFVHKSIFPLGEMVLLKDECEVCGERLKSEKNNGGGINYALTMMLFFINLLWYWPVFGLSWKDEPGVLGGSYSVVYYLVISTVVVLLMQPYLMRLSRMIYLYLYVGFGHSRRVHVDDAPKS
jgi:hypothetical protein